jgi:DNA polymerase III subunit epsilon
MKLFFCDVETSGVEPKQNAILQISGIISCDNLGEQFTLRIKPFEGDVIEKEAIEVNMLDPTKGMEPKEAHRELVKILGRYVDKFKRSDKFFFIGYNASFDNQFLREFFNKANDKYFGSWFFNPALDVMSLALSKLMSKRFAMENFKLPTVAKALGIEFDLDKAHGAEYDVQKTKEMFDKIMAPVIFNVISAGPVEIERV